MATILRSLVCVLLPLSLLGQTPVDIYEDESGIPHVVGGTDEAVMWALGRLQMRDFPVSTCFHLWYASGELAPRLGIIPGQDETWLEVDISHRLWRIPERVQTLHAPRVMADPRLGPLLDSYVAGLEAGRQSWNANPAARDALAGRTSAASAGPGEIARLMSTPITVERVLEWSLSWTGFGARANLARLAGIADLGTGAGFTASNGWVVSRAASGNGSTMLLSDPHLPAETPSFYRSSFATLHGPGLEVGGWFLPGLPFPALGFQDDLAWTATANGVDHHDLWRAFTDSSSIYSLNDGTTRSIVRQTVSVPYLDRTTGQIGSRQVDLSWADAARDLPVLEELVLPAGQSFHSEIVFAGATFVTAPATLVEFLAELAEASSLSDVQSAVDLMALPDQNLLVGCANGDMGYWWLARAPQRSAAAPSLAALQGVLDGNDAAHHWLAGVHPSTSLPREIYVDGVDTAPEVWINCNVSAELTREGPFSTIVPAQHPHGMIVAPPTETWRQARARQLLNAPISPAQHRAAAVDQLDSWAVAMAPRFAQAISLARSAGALGPDPLIDAALQGLAAWDGEADRHSVIAAFAYLLRAKYRQLLAINAGAPGPLPVTAAFDAAYADLPPLATMVLPASLGDVVTLGLALDITVHQLWPSLANLSLSDPSFFLRLDPSSPWSVLPSPRPWASYGPLLELGHIKALDLTPANVHSGSGAFYPVGGAVDSLWQVGTLDLAATLNEVYAGATVVSATATNHVLNGSTRLFSVVFSPSGPQVGFLAPLGMTERIEDPRRYLTAADHAARVFRPLHFDLGAITAPAFATRITSLIAP